MNGLTDCNATPGAKRYLRSLRVAMTVYAVTLLLGVSFVREFPHSAWRWLAMLLPVAPAVFALVSILRFIGAMDELQRRIHLEGLGVAFATTILATLTYGLLERVGAPPLPIIWVCPVMVGLWGIGNAAARARYR